MDLGFSSSNNNNNNNNNNNVFIINNSHPSERLYDLNTGYEENITKIKESKLTLSG
jgi:hypothetical protein